MITQEQFEEFLALEHEIPGVEFKGAGSRRDNPLFGKVVRAAIGMANRRDGGFVIIGVSDQSGVLSSVGLSDEQLVTWRHDDISSILLFLRQMGRNLWFCKFTSILTYQ